MLWRKKAPLLNEESEFSKMSYGELKAELRRLNQEQADNIQHLALTVGMIMLVRLKEMQRTEFKQLEEALLRFGGAPELEPLRQAALNELKRRANEEGDEKAAKILVQHGWA